ncbi:MAG: EamA family transporter RarD [Rectinemataceae bacterium]
MNLDSTGGLTSVTERRLGSRLSGIRGSSAGTAAAFVTYAMWGLFPLYWKRLEVLDSFQILCHRIVWAAAFTLLLLGAQGRLGELVRFFRNGRRAATAFVGAVLISVNWGTYIWAVNSGHVTESSLGYFINPLLSVVLGAIAFKEHMDRWTVAAVAIAAAGVGYASIMLGSVPWISLVLATSFALYGAVKKKAALDPIMGLAAETIAASPFALAFLVFRHARGLAVFGGSDGVATAMLVLAGIVTAVPLITFAFATNRITLQRMGFIQYVSPAGQLALGLFVYGERLNGALRIAFAAVIVAVLIYASTRGRARPGPAQAR